MPWKVHVSESARMEIILMEIRVQEDGMDMFKCVFLFKRMYRASNNCKPTKGRSNRTLYKEACIL